MNHFMEGELRYVGELRPFEQLLFQQGYSQRRTPFSSDIPLSSFRLNGREDRVAKMNFLLPKLVDQSSASCQESGEVWPKQCTSCCERQ